MKTKLLGVYRYIRGREPMVLLGVLLIVLGTWGFIELADEVLEGSTGEFDRWAIVQLRDAEDSSRPIGPDWMHEVGRDITGLGGVAVLCMVIAAAAGFLALNRSYRLMGFLLLSTGSGIAASMLMKRGFARPRPDVVEHLSAVYTSSFPSGHSMMSAIVYLTLGVLLAPVLRLARLRYYVIALALLLTAMIGVSRVYMGVHYPTDVLAGWAAGLVWALLCWLIARTMSKRRA
ncbi:phosphatase PAP2 family protein [Roseimaritima ulvae]|uniref:Phosphatidylglycerophosphatase B n=1 Tax=Roseimaritima ulvae TaxID=980254 RepID=A0A5B9R633_9BACT|nr:phosphatase PAP2 family protein [Roseimaritima ulvae]QEG41961.1 phosphatidylglycerophosphatase B [Roseimaritima ulvae]